MITIQLDGYLDDYAVAPGGETTGTVQWRVDEKPPTEVTIRVGMETTGRGSPDKVVLVDEVRPGSKEGSATITFRIPDDAPCTYDGKLIRVAWTVDVHLKLPW